MEALLRAIGSTLPHALYAHVTPPLLHTLAERYAIEEAEPHLKLALVRPDLLPRHAVGTELLGDADLDEIVADGIETIALNVRADNAAALASYGQLGFETVTAYTEARLVAGPSGR